MKAITLKARQNLDGCEARQKAIEARSWKEDGFGPITECVNAYYSGSIETLVAQSNGEFYKKGGE